VFEGSLSSGQDLLFLARFYKPIRIEFAFQLESDKAKMSHSNRNSSSTGSGTSVGRGMTASWAQMSATSQPTGQLDIRQGQTSSAASPVGLAAVIASGSGGPNSTSGSSSIQSSEEMVSAPSSLAGSLGGPQLLAQIMEQPRQVTEGQQCGEEEQQQQEEENRKLRLQLYVFVLRCISYPFNAKQTNTADLHHRHQQLKLRKAQLEQIVQLHTNFISSPGSFAPARSPHQHLTLTSLQLKQLDELYERCHITFNRKFLQNERMRLLVESECCSQQDFRELFRQNVEQILKESQIFSVNHTKQTSYGLSCGLNRLSAEGENDYLNTLLASKDVVVNSWLIKFESIIRDDQSDQASSTSSTQPTDPLGSTQAAGTSSQSYAQQQQQQQQQQQTFSKEQLYQMFQNILNIKKFEHQLLYNALQLDSADEQAAAIRRELDGRVARIAELERNKKLMPKFVLKEMESLYLEETRMAVNKLMVNLDSLPVMKGTSNESRGVYGLQKFRRYNSR